MQPGDVGAPAEARVEDLVSRSVDMSVVAGVKRDIADIAKRDPELATSGLASMALALAAEMDAKNPASSKSMCAARLKEALDGLRELAPPQRESDAIDEIASRREKRRATAGSPAAADMSRS